jgi:hypothetical protein
MHMPSTSGRPAKSRKIPVDKGIGDWYSDRQTLLQTKQERPFCAVDNNTNNYYLEVTKD